MNFRVTQEELDFLKVSCAAKGARSVSDFARSAVLRAASDGSDPVSQLEGHVARIDHKLALIQETFEQLTCSLPRPAVPWRPDGALRELDRALRKVDGSPAELVPEAESADPRF